MLFVVNKFSNFGSLYIPVGPRTHHLGENLTKWRSGLSSICQYENTNHMYTVCTCLHHVFRHNQLDSVTYTFHFHEFEFIAVFQHINPWCLTLFGQWMVRFWRWPIPIYWKKHLHSWWLQHPCRNTFFMISSQCLIFWVVATIMAWKKQL